MGCLIGFSWNNEEYVLLPPDHPDYRAQPLEDPSERTQPDVVGVSEGIVK
jgi:hypothetical protein